LRGSLGRSTHIKLRTTYTHGEGEGGVVSVVARNLLGQRRAVSRAVGRRGYARLDSASMTGVQRSHDPVALFLLASTHFEA